jgi:hypothetical protein
MEEKKAATQLKIKFGRPEELRANNDGDSNEMSDGN